MPSRIAQVVQYSYSSLLLLEADVGIIYVDFLPSHELTLVGHHRKYLLPKEATCSGAEQLSEVESGARWDWCPFQRRI